VRVDQRGGSQHGHVRGAERRLGVVGCHGGAEEDETQGEDGGCEEGGQC
jgi:hypothetical protein